MARQTTARPRHMGLNFDVAAVDTDAVHPPANARDRSAGGFTLIELLLVVAIIAIIASIAVPNLMAARQSANESAAIATLKDLCSSQAQIRAAAVIDGNGNGVGEYGYFQELSGMRNVKTGSPASGEGTSPISPPVLSGAFRMIDGNGRVLRSGYLFEIHLPGVNMAWEDEDPPTAPYPAVEAAHAQVLWAAYAWPASYGSSGTRAFFVNQSGDILACSNSATRYSGANAPAGRAALSASATRKTSMNHSIAVNATGTDGNAWMVTN